MSLDFKGFVLDFGREIDYGQVGDWYTGSVNAYVKKFSEEFSVDSFLGKVCGADIKEIFCRFWVDLPLADDYRGVICLRLDVVVGDEVVISDERKYDLIDLKWLRYHKVSVSLSSIVGDEDPDDLQCRVYESSIKSIIDEVLERCQGEIMLTLGRSAKACLLGKDGVMFLETGEGEF